MTDPTPVCMTTPRDLAGPPDAYVVHEATTTCTHCNTTTRLFRTYAKQRFVNSDPRVRHGRYVTHMIPCEKIEWNVPVERIPLSHDRVAVCPRCIDGWTYTVGSTTIQHPGLSLTLAVLPVPARPEARLFSAYQATPAGPAGGAAGALTRNATRKAASQAKATLDDMLDNL